MAYHMTDNLRGALFMVAAMGAFAVEDMALKTAAQQIPIGQAIAIFGGVGCIVFALIAHKRSEPIFHPATTGPTMILRSISEISGRLFYALAIALTPLSSASAILQATPVVVALGAIFLFNEKVTLSRWVIILLGFIGVLLIIRPGLDGFQPASIFAVLGMLGFAGRDLATRASPASMSTAQLGVLGFLMFTISGVILMGFEAAPTMPTLKTVLWLGLGIAFGILAYASLTRAVRCGEMSVVAPFRYSRLLFALILGVLVFHERPDLPMILGSAIIVLSGLALMHNQRPRRRDISP